MMLFLYTISFFAIQQCFAAPVDLPYPDHEGSWDIEYRRNTYTQSWKAELDIDLLNRQRCDQDFCSGTVDSNDSTYVCGDARLGPTNLPSCLPISSVVEGSSNYSRFGGLCPGEFLSAWINYAPPGRQGWFFYPYADGFANNTAGEPIRGRLTLKPGTLVDRFGGVQGTFVAPAGSPYNQRALPPANLNHAAGNRSQVPHNYHIYQVNKSLVVLAGPVASWFGQPGYGTQFQLSSTIEDFLSDGVLEEVAVDENGRLRLANGMVFEV
ncbi:hypothetical protein BKA63DRAFT_533171 [Paraphoma chrysanthemicola]|nr:hypothetical protein BKA63DRAFT_533171 [Paraphoma chrysanthemicola]